MPDSISMVHELVFIECLGPTIEEYYPKSLHYIFGKELVSLEI
jgi:hypothetical protein